MHNIELLVSGRERCVLPFIPLDAERAGVKDGETAILIETCFWRTRPHPHHR